jgi:4-carboxymuconolactone decarboxylase
MKNLIAEAPSIAEAFFNMTAVIREHCPLTPRERELIILSVLTANKAPLGIVTHVGRALEAGAIKAEIVSAITLALPLSGISAVNTALDVALETIEKLQIKCESA